MFINDKETLTKSLFTSLYLKIHQAYSKQLSLLSHSEQNNRRQCCLYHQKLRFPPGLSPAEVLDLLVITWFMWPL